MADPAKGKMKRQHLKAEGLPLYFCRKRCKNCILGLDFAPAEWYSNKVAADVLV